MTVTVILLSAVAPSALAAMGAYIGQTTRIYSSPSTSSASMSVPGGMKVSIDAINGGWALIRNGGARAFIPLNQLVLAERMKGYITTATCLYRYASTSSTRSPVLPVNTEVYIIGLDGNFFRVQNQDGSITGYAPVSCVGNARVSVPAPAAPDPRNYVVVMDWYKGGSDVVDRGEYATIYDILSNQFINIKRLGGSAHADIEPATAADTAKLLAACGGEFSWDSRPVILISGSTFVACAMNTMIHGEQSITNNNYDGHCCLHMLNSKTHGTDKINEEHQKAIQAAYSWAH